MGTNPRGPYPDHTGHLTTPSKPIGSSLLVNTEQKPEAGGKLESAPESRLTAENPFRVGGLILALVLWGFPCGSAGKESACNVGDWVRSLGWEDSLEKGKVTPSSILAWRIPWTVRSMGLQRIGQDRATFIFTSQRTIHLLLGPVSHYTPSKHCPSASPQLTRISQTRAYAAAPRF